MYESIALSAGAHRAVAHLGALAYLEDRGMSEDIHSYAGSSGGAVVAALCSVAGTSGVRDLLRLYGAEDVSAPRALHNPFVRHGLVSMGFRSLERRLEASTGKKRATFRDVRRVTGKSLFVSAFRVDDGRTVFFGPDDDVAVVDAVRASTAIPLLVPPVRIDGGAYVDGAIAAYLPTAALPAKRSLGLLIDAPPGNSGSLGSYLNRLVVAVLKNTNDLHGDICRITCKADGTNVLARQTPKQSTELFWVGYGAMRDHVERGRSLDAREAADPVGGVRNDRDGMGLPGLDGVRDVLSDELVSVARALCEHEEDDKHDQDCGNHN